MTDRDDKILRLVARYRVVTADVLLRFFFPDATPKAVERVTTRLVQEELLRSTPLFGRQHCFTLTAKGARLLGLDEKAFARPQGSLSLIRAVSMLLFCTNGPVAHRKMTAQEFKERFPPLFCRGMSHERYYIDSQARLSLLVGDFGADWRRIARKVRREVERRKPLPGWNELIRKKLFAVTVLVATDGKAAPLRGVLGKESFPSEIVVLPELTQFLF